MLFNPRHDEHVKKLEERLLVAEEITSELMSDMIASACGRFSALGAVTKVKLDWLIEAGAWTDAALTLVEFELPQWELRRLVKDEGEWLCTLSRQPALPLEFDEVAEARHQLLPVAILLALLQAKRASGTAAAGMNPASQDAASQATSYAANLTASRAVHEGNVPLQYDVNFSAIINGARHRNWPGQPARQEPAVTASVIVLAALVLLCAGMLVPPLWTAVTESSQFRPGGQECSVLEAAADRQACYEERNVWTKRHPAKGANAPATLRLSGQRSE